MGLFRSYVQEKILTSARYKGAWTLSTKFPLLYQASNFYRGRIKSYRWAYICLTPPTTFVNVVNVHSKVLKSSRRFKNTLQNVFETMFSV